MSRPYFSIVCSLRKNYENFYNQLINGFKNQTFSDFECLLINDESDNGWIILPDNRFKPVFLNREYGLAEKRNIGISEARGKYVIFCDSDDSFPLDLLKTFYDIAEKYNADFIVPKVTRDEKDFISNKHTLSENCFIETKDKISDIFFGRYSSEKYAEDGFVLDGCWGRAFKREILEKYSIRFFEEPCRAEDALFNNDFVLHIESLYLLPDYYGYYWRLNQSSEMFNIDSFFFNINPFLDILYKQLKSCDKKYSENIDSYSAELIFGQFNKFCSAYKKRKTTMNAVVLKLSKMFCKGTVCYTVIRNKSALKSKYMKAFGFLFRAKAYRVAVLAAKIYMDWRKIS